MIIVPLESSHQELSIKYIINETLSKCSLKKLQDGPREGRKQTFLNRFLTQQLRFWEYHSNNYLCEYY